MWKDHIVEEIRAIREEHARKYDYDLRAIFDALKEEEKKSGRKIVSFHPKRFSPYKTGQKRANETA
jgi:hypothetical protein